MSVNNGPISPQPAGGFISDWGQPGREFKENNNYTIGYFSFNNCQQHLYTIEKSNDTITTYYCPRDGWFRTFPDAECSKVCRRTMRFDQAFDYYQKSIQKNG